MTDPARLHPLRSAIYDAAYIKAEKAAEEMRKPLDQSTLDAIASEAEARAVFGADAKKDSKGNFIPQGIGSPQNPSANSLAAIRRYEGEKPYQTALMKHWKENPDWCKRAGIEQPARLGE